MHLWYPISAIPLWYDQGIPPMDAVERLNRFKEEFKIRERKHELYSGKQYLKRLGQNSTDSGETAPSDAGAEKT